MKSVLLFLCIIISLSAISQNKYVNVKNGNDSVSLKKEDSITSKTVFYITLEDINRYMDKMKDKVSARQYDYILAGIQSIITEMIQEKKNKLKP